MLTLFGSRLGFGGGFGSGSLGLGNEALRFLNTRPRHLHLEADRGGLVETHYDTRHTVGFKQAVDDVGLDLGIDRLGAVDGYHIEIVGSVHLLRLLVAFGILRHASRISQNVEGTAEAQRMSDTLQEETDNVNEEERTSRLAWFLTGAIIGATAAVLYAPQRGKETRHYLTDKAQQSREAVSETTQDIIEAGRDMFERGRRLVEDAAELFERGRKLVKG